MSVLKSFQVLAIPGWIYRSLLRRNYTLDDLSNYKKLKESLSFEDFVDWIIANEKFKVKNSLLSTRPLFSSFTDSVEDLEDFTKLENLTISGEILSSFEERISVDPTSISNHMTQEGYHFILNGLTLYVILNETFLSRMSTEDEYWNTFVRDYLKHCYKVASIPEVSLTPMFAEYVKSL